MTEKIRIIIMWSAAGVGIIGMMMGMMTLGFAIIIKTREGVKGGLLMGKMLWRYMGGVRGEEVNELVESLRRVLLALAGIMLWVLVVLSILKDYEVSYGMKFGMMMIGNIFIIGAVEGMRGRLLIRKMGSNIAFYIIFTLILILVGYVIGYIEKGVGYVILENSETREKIVIGTILLGAYIIRKMSLRDDRGSVWGRVEEEIGVGLTTVSLKYLLVCIVSTKMEGGINVDIYIEEKFVFMPILILMGISMIRIGRWWRTRNWRRLLLEISIIITMTCLVVGEKGIIALA